VHSPSEADAPARPRPGTLRRLAAGAWHVAGGFAFLLRRPGLWPLALAPTVLTAAGLFGGLILGLYAIRGVESVFRGSLAGLPELASVVVTLALWAGTLAAGLLLGLAVALLLSAPATERLSRRVERLAGGVAPERDQGLAWEAAQALRGSLYFLAAMPAVFALNLVPAVGPLAGALWGAHALAHQLADAPLTRRGFDFRARRAWHRDWRPESIGFGLAGLVVLIVPGANLLLGPALAVGGTLLVIELQTHAPAQAVVSRGGGAQAASAAVEQTAGETG
jgi:CysZ protein